jgi:hypothetical protein
MPPYTYDAYDQSPYDAPYVRPFVIPPHIMHAYNKYDSELYMRPYTSNDRHGFDTGEPLDMDDS